MNFVEKCTPFYMMKVLRRGMLGRGAVTRRFCCGIEWSSAFTSYLPRQCLVNQHWHLILSLRQPCDYSASDRGYREANVGDAWKCQPRFCNCLMINLHILIHSNFCISCHTRRICKASPFPCQEFQGKERRSPDSQSRMCHQHCRVIVEFDAHVSYDTWTKLASLHGFVASNTYLSPFWFL